MRKKQKINEKWKSVIFGPWKAEIGLGTAIFGIAIKNDRVYRNSRPNPCLGDLFRGDLKISVPNMVFLQMWVPPGARV